MTERENILEILDREYNHGGGILNREDKYWIREERLDREGKFSIDRGNIEQRGKYWIEWGNSG